MVVLFSLKNVISLKLKLSKRTYFFFFLDLEEKKWFQSQWNNFEIIF